MLKLIKQTLTTSIAKQGKITCKKVGVPQGSPISPLYSDIYLNVIDQVWHSRGYPEKLSATLHRYCDDAILVCRKSASLALEKFTELAKRLSLIINHRKTRITKLKEGFNFIT
ncbi:reverse transcriptase domain-containing protein [Cardinium endosymbiont of Oedothorax gibbosus]|uniref:reverse transcriptase domain-containing protein n=1 Tax=Cardinium endosymbiont of Oedothorax gibbosus TaxID=931101 RepID=UPI002025A11C|nr:reverse transcriptase domain-containing protein [Cardinium endosymbiont of Oedothorax gibbosus]